MILSSTSDVLKVVTTTADNLYCQVDYEDWVGDFHSGGMIRVAMASVRTKISSATTTTILAAPAAGASRRVAGIHLSTPDGLAAVLKSYNGVDYQLFEFSLAKNESLVFDGSAWHFHEAGGAEVVLTTH